ncbi:MAG: ROK family transcriptional regulator, partial [Actinomycetota bacterium]|nr:ROK family transcriptional regulator [Actinomycetota bacterium]
MSSNALAPPAGRRAGSAKHVMSPQDLGQVNRLLLMQALVDHGPLSRAELARLLGVPRASVGTIANQLLAEGVLAEEPTRTGGRGKPATPVWFAESAGLTGAVSIEASRVEVGLVNARGQVQRAASRPIEPSIGAAELEDLVLALVDEVLGADLEALVGIGLVVPAQVRPSASLVELCTIVPSLTESALPARLATATGRPVWLEQDVRALAAAERWFGTGRGAASFAVLQIDLGVGVGVVVDGYVFPGEESASPQYGHTCVDLGGLPCTCGLTGCWETVASLAWLRTEAAAHGIEDAAQLGPRDLARLAGDGNAEAEDVLERFAQNLAVGLANVVLSLRTPRIVLQG